MGRRSRAAIELVEGSLTGGRRSRKLRAKLITGRLAGTTGVRRGRLGGSLPDFMLRNTRLFVYLIETRRKVGLFSQAESNEIFTYFIFKQHFRGCFTL